MKDQSLLLFSIFLIILSAGCASNHPIIGAWRGANFSPARTDKIALTLRPNPSAEDAELGRLLTAELQQERFQLVPVADANYLLSYAVEDDSTENFVPRRDFVVAQPYQTTRDIIASESSAPPGFTRPQEFAQQSAGPNLIVYHAKGIRLYLYSNPKTQSGKFQMAWSGCIEAGERISAEREPLLIKTLLDYFGQDYSGRVTLPDSNAIATK